MKKSTLFTLASFIFLAVGLVYGYLWYKDVQQYRKGNVTYQDMSAKYLSSGAQPLATRTPTPQSATATTSAQTVTTDTTPLATATPEVTPTPSPDDLDLIRIRNIIAVDFTELQKMNPDVVGWIFQEGTNINYPIMRGKDNTFYLTHLPDMAPNKLGSIFMNVENTGTMNDDTTVIFGHNMQDESMFATLEKYKAQQYFEQHPSLYILTPTDYYRVDIFAGYVIGANDIKSLHFNFRDRRERDKFVMHAYERSVITSPVELAVEDQFVSLITCSYDIYDARFMLNGKLVKLTR